MNERRGGLGPGLGALIPTAPAAPVRRSTHGRPGDAARGRPTAPADRPTVRPDAGELRWTSDRPGRALRRAARRRRSTPEPAPAAPGLRRGGDGRAGPLDPRGRAAAAGRRAPGRPRPATALRAGHGRAPLAGRPSRPGSTAIPAIVRETADDALLRDALLENLHRSQLNPLEEAAAYDQLLQGLRLHPRASWRTGSAGRARRSPTPCGCSGCPPPVQRRVAAGVLSAGHARALLALDDADAQERLAHRIVAEGLSVRAVEEIVDAGRRRAGPEPRTSGPKRDPIAPGLDDLAAAALGPASRPGSGSTSAVRGARSRIDFASLDDLDRIVAADWTRPRRHRTDWHRPDAGSADRSQS